MKLKVLTPTAAVLFLLSAFTPFSFAEKDLIGTWKIDDGSIGKVVKRVIEKTVEANPEAADQIEEHKDEIAQRIKGVRLNVKADHTYESISPAGTNPGTWKYLDAEKAVEFTKKDGTKRKDILLELSPTRLKMVNTELKDTILYVHP
ncbi:hypothetical protein FPZ43_16110 [Mucilaginibacter pallidiroseus]|uniref:Lipocalin-like domain-containing protein n=1 Tax=Mucilaginibacter pallidiroseus TaxID=2599295 RepID=A0A563U386_9SPHI|nr:hypothetical protein [Mucilaginibacter pallidiroseus]TWR25807.1 hypothetical protein FPZ43_16110 [Mucilaginibacter pallidiroseus]